MRKITTFLLSLLLNLLYLFQLSACNISPKFELTAETELSTIISGNSFCVHVHTKNIGQTHRYRGSSTIIGATASLYMETDHGKVYLEHDPISVTDDITEVVIKKNEVISRDWTFFTDTNTLQGEYTLSLTYLDDKVVIPQFITIII